MSARRRVRRRVEMADLELTAFINPMVVLVTFLLVNVVFSHSAVLDLNLPAPANGTVANPADKMLLEVTVREHAIEIGDRNRGRLAEIPNAGGGPDLAQLSARLQGLKAQHPDQKDATMLVEPGIDYNRLVQVMDVVRATAAESTAGRRPVELFPEIAIGDAPLASSATSVAR